MMDDITREINEQIKLISELDRELLGLDNRIEAGEISPAQAEEREKEIEAQIKEARREKHKLDQEKGHRTIKTVVTAMQKESGVEE